MQTRHNILFFACVFSFFLSVISCNTSNKQSPTQNPEKEKHSSKKERKPRKPKPKPKPKPTNPIPQPTDHDSKDERPELPTKQLFEAIKKGALEEIEELFKSHRYDIETRNEAGVTAFFYAVDSNQLDIAQFLQSQGADINAPREGKEAYTPLHVASMSGKKPMVEWLVGLENIQIDSQDFQKATPLLLSISEGHRDITKILLDKGANINAVDMYGSSSAHYLSNATRYGHGGPIMFHLLNKSGDYEDRKGEKADFNLKNNDNNTPLHLLAKVQKASLSFLGILYVKLGKADPAILDKDGNNALHIACINDIAGVCQDIIKQHPNLLNIPNAQGAKPHQLAAQANGVRCYRVFTSEKYLTKELLDKQDKEGNSTLHYWAKELASSKVRIALWNQYKQNAYYQTLQNKREILDKILSFNPKLNLLNNQNKTPLDIAEEPPKNSNRRSKGIADIMKNRNSNFKNASQL